MAFDRLFAEAAKPAGRGSRRFIPAEAMTVEQWGAALERTTTTSSFSLFNPSPDPQSFPAALGAATWSEPDGVLLGDGRRNRRWQKEGVSNAHNRKARV